MDSTKNVIKNQTKHQIPEKTKEQLEQEAWMQLPPTRQEMINYVQDVHAHIVNSFNMVSAVLQNALLDKGLLTLEELEKAGNDMIEKYSTPPEDNNDAKIEKDTETAKDIVE